MIDSNHPHKHGYNVLLAESGHLDRMADDVEKIIKLVHRIYGERGLDVLDGISGGEKTPRDDINEWRAKAESLRESAYVLKYGDTEEPDTIQDPKVQVVVPPAPVKQPEPPPIEDERSCWTCGYYTNKGVCTSRAIDSVGVEAYLRESGGCWGPPKNRHVKCPAWKRRVMPIGSVEGP